MGPCLSFWFLPLFLHFLCSSVGVNFTLIFHCMLNHTLFTSVMSQKCFLLSRFVNDCYKVFITYLLTPWCRVLLEKLTGLQLVMKLPAFYGTRRFITALTSVRHLSLSCASPSQSTYPHPTSWRSILILSTHLCVGLPSGLFPSGFPTKTVYATSPHPYAPHAQPISFFLIILKTLHFQNVSIFHRQSSGRPNISQ